MVAESAPLYAVGIGCSQNWFDQASDLFAGVKPATESAERNSELTRALCDAALEALASILCGADGRLHRRQSGIVELMEAPGSGFLSFACSFEDSSAEIQIVGWPAWVASFGYSPSQINRKSEPLVPVANALGSESVLVSAIVGEAELPIGEFARLAVGDVLVVERLLEEPLAVQIDGGDVFAGGHLCAVDGMKAIELLPSNT